MKEVYHYRGDGNHPRFFGFVPGPASSISWLGDIILLHTISMQAEVNLPNYATVLSRKYCTGSAV